MLTTQDYKNLITKKCPPETEADNVFASIIISIAERADLLAKQNGELTKAVKFMAKVIGEMRGVGADAIDTEATESVDATTTAGAASAAPSAPADKTPFPAGVAATASPDSKPGTKPEPIVVGETAEDLRKAASHPDAGSQPAVNAQPIPSAAPAAAPIPSPTKSRNGAEAKA